VIHAATQIFLGKITAQCILIAILGQAAHVFDHAALTIAFMIERKAAAVGRRWFE